MRFSIILLCFIFEKNASDFVADGKMQNVFSWNQIGYDFDGVKYTKDSDIERNPNMIYFEDELPETDKFFIQYNNVPVGFEVYGDKVFISVPRRRYGIPSTLNYVNVNTTSPLLRPFPRSRSERSRLFSVYRPRVDRCQRLWAVDTGLLEAPGARRQVNQPAIVVFDLKSEKLKLRYNLKPTDLASDRTSGGLTSITVDVSPTDCEDTYAYITDLATEGVVVFSLKRRSSWRIDHPSFRHEEAELNFTVAGFTIPWKDGLFSIAMSETDAAGGRDLYYHALASGQEFKVRSDELKNGKILDAQPLGHRGPNSQSGSHAYHSNSGVLLYATVARDAILCWNVETPLIPEYVEVVAQDHEKMVYISDLKIVNEEVWILANKMPVYVFSTLNKNEPNFFVHKANIRDLIKGTKCDQDLDDRIGQKSHQNQ